MFVAVNKATNEVWGPFDSAEQTAEWCRKGVGLIGSKYEGGWAVTEMAHTEDFHDLAPAMYHRTFGPGKLEAIDLRVWADGVARITGAFLVFCGNGNRHEFTVDSGYIQRFDWALILDQSQLAHGTWSFDDVQYDAVGRVVEDVVGEEWTDPCEGDGDDQFVEAGEEGEPLEEPGSTVADDEAYIEAATAEINAFEGKAERAAEERIDAS